MNLYNYDKQVKPTKTVRILVYPNITFGKDLEKDSYIQVIKKQITLLNQIRNDLWFYLILPKEVPSLAFDNTTQLLLDIPTHPPTMRAHFDTQAVKKLCSNNLDFDLVMSHLPEHTYDLKNVLHNVTQHTPKFFGYCHWFDFKNVVNWPMNSFKKNILGILEMDRCYLNTESQKKLVLTEAKETFNDETISKLDKILTVQHLGVDKKDIIQSVQHPKGGQYDKSTKKIIVFNHRPDTYKHYKEFLNVCDKLYKQRQDFNVWVPLASKSDRDYVITDSGDKDFYYKMLQTSYIGYSPKQTYGGWSVATTDGMMNGVPYLMYDADYYRELWNEGVFIKNDDELLEKLNYYLDNEYIRNDLSDEGLAHIRKKLVFKKEIEKMSEYIDELLKKLPIVKKSEKIKDMIKETKRKGGITKKDFIEYLGWGVGIKWTPYRRALLTNPKIYDTMSKDPVYKWIK